jgi:hypothetical protein
MFQKRARIVVAADPPRHFGQHPQRRYIAVILAQVRLEQAFGDGDVIGDQRLRCLLETGMVDRGAQFRRLRHAHAREIPGLRQLRRQQTPDIGPQRVFRQRLPQRRDRGTDLPCAASASPSTASVAAWPGTTRRISAAWRSASDGARPRSSRAWARASSTEGVVGAALTPADASCRAGQAPPQAFLAENLARGVVAGRTGHPAAGMGAGPAQVQALERPAIGAVAQERARRPQLIERHVAVHDVPAVRPNLRSRSSGE